MQYKYIASVIYLLISLNSTFGQQTLKDSVIQKLAKDKRAFDNFRVLGELYAIDSLINSSKCVFICFSDSYNRFDPFCRLVDYDSLKVFYGNTLKKSKAIRLFEFDYNYYPEIQNDKKKSYYFNKLEEIQKYWSKKRKAKKLYLAFIRNPKNYRTDLDEEELNEYMRKYLRHYFIFIRSK